jgi:amino-acid N-acetyltransferase
MITTLRAGHADDAPAMHALVATNLEAGHLLPRTLHDLRAHADRFEVVVHGDTLVGCAELAPLSAAVAEVRSLVVDEAWRGRGLGPRLVARLQRRARLAGFSTLCAFAHDPGHFVRLGFTIVPHVWFPEKVALDCAGCARFRHCGQHAVALALDGSALHAPAASHRREPLTAAAPLARVRRVRAGRSLEAVPVP